MLFSLVSAMEIVERTNLSLNKPVAAMVYEFGMVVSAASATVLIETLIRDNGRRYTSLRLKSTVIHITCVGAPKIF